MFGPLPRRYTLVLVTAVLAVGIGLGGWLGTLEITPFLVPGGIVLGGGLAALAAYALIHEPHHASTPVRVRHRRH